MQRFFIYWGHIYGDKNVISVYFIKVSKKNSSYFGPRNIERLDSFIADNHIYNL